MARYTVHVTTQRVHPAIGDPAEFVRDMALFKKSCHFFDSHYYDLLQQYPDEWIGIFDGEVRAHATDIHGMLAQLDAVGVPRGTTYAEFLATNPLPEVL